MSPEQKKPESREETQNPFEEEIALLESQLEGAEFPPEREEKIISRLVTLKKARDFSFDEEKIAHALEDSEATEETAALLEALEMIRSRKEAIQQETGEAASGMSKEEKIPPEIVAKAEKILKNFAKGVLPGFMNPDIENMLKAYGFTEKEIRKTKPGKLFTELKKRFEGDRQETDEAKTTETIKEVGGETQAEKNEFSETLENAAWLLQKMKEKGGSAEEFEDKFEKFFRDAIERMVEKEEYKTIAEAARAILDGISEKDFPLIARLRTEAPEEFEEVPKSMEEVLEERDEPKRKKKIRAMARAMAKTSGLGKEGEKEFEKTMNEIFAQFEKLPDTQKEELRKTNFAEKIWNWGGMWWSLFLLTGFYLVILELKALEKFKEGIEKGIKF